MIDIKDPKVLELLNNLHNVSSECLLTVSRMRDVELSLSNKQTEIEACIKEKDALSLQVPELVNRGTSDLSLRFDDQTKKYITLAKESWNKNTVIWITIIISSITGIGIFIKKIYGNRIM